MGSNVDFYPGSQIEYYYDETILAIAWKELINNKVCTFAEVKIADGSQLRRMIANNSYGSDVQLYPTDMAASANAVIAISGDYYIFRQLGITVYQRQLYRSRRSPLTPASSPLPATCCSPARAR